MVLHHIRPFSKFISGEAGQCDRLTKRTGVVVGCKKNFPKHKCSSRRSIVRFQRRREPSLCNAAVDGEMIVLAIGLSRIRGLLRNVPRVE